MLSTSMQTPDHLNLKVDNADSYLPHRKLIRRMKACHCLDPCHLPLTTSPAYKNLFLLPRKGGTAPEA